MAGWMAGFGGCEDDVLVKVSLKSVLFDRFFELLL